MLQDLGNVRDIDQRSPNTECHFLTLVCFGVTGMLSNISISCSIQYGGRWIVIVMVSMVMVAMVQPRTNLIVLIHEQSPCRNFLMDMGSCQKGPSLGSRGRKMSSMACSKIVWTCHSVEVVWAKPTKSSTIISM